MDNLDMRICESQLERLAQEQAERAWAAGDILLKMRNAMGGGDAWKTMFFKTTPRATEFFTPQEISLYMKAAETYSIEEREYKLPWCMYAYAAKHTTDPAVWIRRAVCEDWKFSDLRRNVLDEKKNQPQKEDTDESVATMLCQQPIWDAAGAAVGLLTVYINCYDADAEPWAALSLIGDTISPSGLTALREAIEKCEREIQDYLGKVHLDLDDDLKKIAV